jgi:hypothetical protein
LELKSVRNLAGNWKGTSYIIISIVFGFLFLSTVLVDYVYCCNVNCAQYESITGPLWSYYFNQVNPFFQDHASKNVYFWPLMELSVQAAIWLIVCLASFVQVRRIVGRVTTRMALFDTLQLSMWIVFLFELGIYFICPSWRSSQVSNLQNVTPFRFFNNTDLLIFSVIMIVTLQTVQLILSRYVGRGGLIHWK